MGCANQEALSVPFVLLCPSARWMRPEGVTNPGEKKPSKEDVPTQKGGQRGPSGPGETALAPAHLSPYRWALTARVQFAICQAQGVPTGSGARALTVDEFRSPQPEELAAWHVLS